MLKAYPWSRWGFYACWKPTRKAEEASMRGELSVVCWRPTRGAEEASTRDELSLVCWKPTHEADEAVIFKYMGKWSNPNRLEQKH